MIVVAGTKPIHKIVWIYIRTLFLEKRKIVVVDAANRFDPYFISKISINSGISPYIILKNIIIARTFTPFQLLKLLEKVKSYSENPFVCLGFNNLFEDENISSIHAWRVFKKCVSIVRNIKNLTILTAQNDISVRNFIPYLKKSCDVFIEEERVLKPEIKNGEKKLWEGQLHLLAQF